jgi:hypothetical protein
MRYLYNDNNAPMKTPANPDKFKKQNPKPPKKSLMELVKEVIPKGKYKGLSKILEPHELPDC